MQNEGSALNLSSLRSASQPSTVILFTGLSGSGKTSMGEMIAQRMQRKGSPCCCSTEIPFGGIMRQTWVSRGRIAPRTFCAQGGWHVRQRTRDRSLCSPLSHRMRRAGHDCASRWSPTVFSKSGCRPPWKSASSAIQRGLYKRARSNELPSFTGVSEAYEPPTNPGPLLPTHLWSLDQCCELLLDCLRLNNLPG